MYSCSCCSPCTHCPPFFSQTILFLFLRSFTQAW
uniref:Uncharacterized protein n=1 Tax=Arundo donax TaxID=35708 RepID=A0A0A8Y5L7_ARUDO